MRTRLHLKPRQKGTKQLLAQYGDRLVCVRYRYDAQQKKRFKTVELIVAEREWDPPASRFADDAIVGVRVGFAEVEIRDQVKRAGGKWNRGRKVWELRVVPQFEFSGAYFLSGPLFWGACCASACSISPTISSMLHSVWVTPVAIAGDIRKTSRKAKLALGLR